MGTPLPHVADYADPFWRLCVIRHPDRDSLQAQLQQAGNSAMILYPIHTHRQPAYADMNLSEGSLPIAEAIHREVLRSLAKIT